MTHIVTFAFIIYIFIILADWRYRHAALMAISACAEGCHQQMEGMLNTILDAVLPFLKDPVSLNIHVDNVTIFKTDRN